MELIHAALLLHSADQEITEDSVTGVLDGAGIEYESAEVKALLAALDEVDIDEAMDTAVATGAAPAAPADGGAAEEADEAEADEAEEADEDEAPEGDDVDEEEAAEGLGSLF